MKNLKNIAMLIDADNTQLSKLESVIQEISTNGRIVVKRAYGNWRKGSLKNWENELKRLAIKAEQQFDYVAGKNATDMALVIDTLDLLHSGIYDAFVIVASDSDYTPLAIKLRESGVFVMGVGEKKTPEPFRNACDEFVYLENLSKDTDTQTAAVQKPAETAKRNAQESAEERRKAKELKEIHKLLITASGGPFRGRTTEELRRVTVADTLKHPNWVMGRKITVDSATLVNKGLEVMEAKWLFDMDLDHIQVVVQPQSIIHSMVEFKDGAIMAQLGTPDMRLPIQYALYYPHRRYLDGDRLDFTKLHEITFEVPDMETFRGLPMAIQASREGGSMPTVFNAANELAVKKFLEEKIGFLDIYEIIAQSMERHTVIRNPELEEILAVEDETYKWIESRW